MDSLTHLIILFFSAFLAATIFPAQSEILLGTMHNDNISPASLLVLVATTGNTLGAVLNFFLGRYLLHLQNKKWFPINKKSLDKASTIFQKYGVWSLLLSWMPIIGDPLTLVAGVLKVSFPLFLLLVTVGKALRYISVILII